MLDRLYEAFFVKKREVIPPFRLGRIFVLARRVHPAIAAGLAGAFVLFLINYDYFLMYLCLPLPAGFDGASHLAAGIEYAKNIFPSFWGWTPKWQLGMPFPVFYPPLFYFIFALLSKLFYFFPAVAIFKTIVISSVLLVPAAFAFLSYKIEKTRVSAWFSSMASAFAISTFGPYGNIGLNLYSTFNVGLVTQALSLPMFVFWFCSLIGMENSRFRFVFSTLALSLVALSSAHMIFPAVIFFTAAFALSLRRSFKVRDNARAIFRKVLLYFSSGFISVALASFWLVPMIANRRYFFGISLGIGSGIGAQSMFDLLDGRWFFAAVVVAAVFISFLARKIVWFAVAFSAFLLVLPAVFHLENYFEGFSVHTYRFVSVFLLFSAPLYGFLISLAVNSVRVRIVRQVIYCLAFFVLVLVWARGLEYRNYAGFDFEYDRGETLRIFKALDGEDGRFLIESSLGGRSLNAALTSGYDSGLDGGILGSHVVFVEPSISSYFVLPTLNALSVRNETASIASRLNDQVKKTDKKETDRWLQNARSLGIEHFLVFSKGALTNFEQSSLVLEKGVFGKWKLFGFKNLPAPSLIFSPAVNPVLLYAPLEPRGESLGFDFLSISEDIYAKGKEDIFFALANDRMIDGGDDVGVFGAMAVFSYDYADIEAAYKKIISATKTLPVFLAPSGDPLFRKLGEAPRENIFIMDWINGAENYAEDRNIFFDRVKKEATRDGVVRQEVAAIVFGSKAIKGKIAGDPLGEVRPFIVRSTYFPAWKNMAGGLKDVYLVSPSFILVFTKDEINLRFETPQSVFLGYTISVLSLVILALVTVSIRFSGLK